MRRAQEDRPGPPGDREDGEDGDDGDGEQPRGTGDTAGRTAEGGDGAETAGDGDLPFTGLAVGALALAGAVLLAAGAALRRRARR